MKPSSLAFALAPRCRAGGLPRARRSPAANSSCWCPSRRPSAPPRTAYAQTLDPIRKQGKLNDDPALKARVDKITARLVAQAIKYRPETASWDWQVAVIDDPNTLNAWCMAGGKMAIYTGLIQKLNLTDDEIAQVMGHEIAHALAKHTAERMSDGDGIAGRSASRRHHCSATAAHDQPERRCRPPQSPPRWASSCPTAERRSRKRTASASSWLRRRAMIRTPHRGYGQKMLGSHRQAKGSRISLSTHPADEKAPGKRWLRSSRR